MSNQICNRTAPIMFTTLLALGACTDTTEPMPTGEAPSTGALTLWRNEGGLEGRFARDGRTVSFETRSRAMTIDAETHLDVDVRFVDEDGFAYFVGMGGHAPIDPSWTDDLDADPVVDRHDAKKHATDFALAYEALDAIRAKAESAGDLALTQAPELPALLAARAAWAEHDRPLVLTDVPASAAATNYYHELTIKKKPAFWGLTPGEHSAVVLRIFTTGFVLVRTVYTSNHGTAAIDQSMGFQCSRTWGRAGSVTPLTNQSFCTTDWGLLPLTHLCNDDTLMQYGDVKANGILVWPQCRDAWLNAYAPTCN